MKKLSLLFVLIILLFACTNQKEQKATRVIPLKIAETKGYVVPKGSVSEPEVIIIDKSKLTVVPVGKPKVVLTNTNVYHVSKIKPIPSGKPNIVYIPATNTKKQNDTINQIYRFTNPATGDTLQLPKTIAATYSPFIAEKPEMVIAKDPNIRDQNPANFSNFSILQGLSNNTVLSMIEDKNGNLWLGTNGGVSKYDGKSFTNFTRKEGLANNTVLSIIEDKNGNLWFGTNGGGVSKYDGRSFTNFTQKEGLANNTVLSIIEDKNGNLWFGTYGGVSKYDGKSFTNFTQKEGLANNAVWSIIEDKNGNLWFGSNGGVSKYDGKSFTNFTQKEGLANNTVWSIIEDKNGNLWFGTNDGVSKYDGKSFTNFTREEGLANNPVLSMIEDENGNLWLGTNGGGVSKYDGRSFTNFTQKEGLANNTVLSMIEDENGNLWFGSNGGISKYDGKSFTNFTQKEGLANNTVWSMIEDKNGNLWFGTYGGVSKYDGKSFTNFTQEEGLTNNTVWSIIEDKNGNLWFGTNGGVSKYDGKSFTNFTQKEGLANNTVLSIIEDKNGNLWFGTYGGGVSKYDGKSFTNFTQKEGLANNAVWSIIEDKNGNLWFGTNGGVSKYDGKSFINFTQKEGLSNNTVLSMIEDKNGNLWFGTESGLCKLSVLNNVKLVKIIENSKLSTYKSQASPPKNEVFFKNYSYNDGFVGVGVNNGRTICEASDGTIWIGTNDRLMAYHPNGDVPDIIAPNMQLTGIELFGEDINWVNIANHTNSIASIAKDTSFALANGIEVGNLKFNGLTRWYNLPKNLSLAYNNNSLSFNFIGITIKYPKKVKYQYMLIGMDKNWSAITNKNYASYGNLPHGNYTFKVKAMNSECYWSNEYNYKFEIRPPWWLTWWFKTIYITASVLLLFGLYRWRTAAMRKRQKELEQTVEKRTYEIKEAYEELNQQAEELQLLNDNLNQQNEEITTQRDEIEKQKQVEAKIYYEVSESINYATRLQGVILPEEKLLEKYVSEHFVLFKPKDKVSGDFYWWANVENHTIITAADSTGHGVPGAFMSMLGASFLREIVEKEYIHNTGIILERLRREIIKTLKQKGKMGEQKDGMDMAIISINHETNIVQYSGANNPLYILTNRKLDKLEPLKDFEHFYEIKPDKMPIAIYEKMDNFTTHEIQLEKSDQLYMFSDGFTAQFGGPKGKKFKYRPFKRLFAENRGKTMKEQKDLLNSAFDTWRGDLEQVDDVVVLGIRI